MTRPQTRVAEPTARTRDASGPEHSTTGPLATNGQQAACIGRADVMETDEQRALALCRSCPSLTLCREWVLALPYGEDPGGVCGGLTERQRTKARWGDDPCPDDPKRCTTCRETKTRADFHSDPNHNDGLRSNCADCSRAYAARYRARKKEEA